MPEGIEEAVAALLRDNPPPEPTEQQIATVRALLDPPAEAEAS